MNGEKKESDQDVGNYNLKIIKNLYKALAVGNTETVVKLVASDVEWWFHGPPQCQHMMRILTGKSRRSTDDQFKFKPRTIAAMGNRVVVEGWEGNQAYWVHVWVVDKDGMVTQFREYFNTWLTVILRVSEVGDAIRLWQSEPRQRQDRSLPDLVLAI